MTHPARREKGEGAGLEHIFRLTMAVGAVAFGLQLANTYRDPEAGGRTAALIGLLVCLAMFVPWSRLPLVSGRVARPAPILSIVTRFFLAASIGALPILLREGEVLIALGALATTAASAGIWLRWRQVAWAWYAILAVALVLGVHDLWQDVLGREKSALAALDLALRLPGFLVWMAFLGELVEWHRGLHAEAKSRAAAAPAATPPEARAEASPADEDPTPSEEPTPPGP